MRTLPSGSKVALCPERGFSIGAAGLTEPTREAAGITVREGMTATAKLVAVRVVRKKRSLFMGFSLGW